MATGVGIDPARIAQLTEREEAHLNAETSGSARMYERSRKTMPMGVASSYQARSPHPMLDLTLFRKPAFLLVMLRRFHLRVSR